MEFIELPPFPKKLSKYGATQALEAVKNELVDNPRKSSVVKGTGGCRKIRIAIKQDKGKSGGGRVIYYFIDAEQRIYFILIYAKNEQSELSQEDKKRLRSLTEGLEK